MSKLVDPKWQERYRDMIATPDQALEGVRPGNRVFIGTGCGEPQELVRALVRRADELADIELVQVLSIGEAGYTRAEYHNTFRVNTFFIGDHVREAVQEGHGDYTPIFLSDIPRLFATGRLPLDVALIQVSPPDEHGMVSLGVSVDVVKGAAENASLVIAQVNPHMPRTAGDSLLNVFDLDVLVPFEEELIEFRLPDTNEVTRKIGEVVASLIEDGSTIELGIGRIPHAVLDSLGEKKDLGIHSEMITDQIIDLVEKGVINGARKNLDRGRVVASFCLGTRRLYDYLDDNPKFSFRPTEYVNNPFVIGQLERMVGINVALEVDLTGQVCADSLGSRFFSGIGGQVDFNRGAAAAPGGKAIIALPATAQSEGISRIVSQLNPGAGVVTSRGDVHYVVTEYGIAYLHGKTVQERAMALISVAHPKFRAQLLQAAIKLKYVRPELADVEGRLTVTPRDLRASYVLDDGTLISFRGIHPTDETRMKSLFYKLSQETIYYRFFTHLKRFPQQRIQDFVYIDHRRDVAIVGTVPEASGDEIVAVGRYYLDEKTNRAEVAFVVADAWQNRGIGTFLLRTLLRTAKSYGISGFTAAVLPGNKAMMTVFQKSGCKMESHFTGEVYHVEIDFDAPAGA